MCYDGGMKLKKRVKELEKDVETFYDTWTRQFEANEGTMQLFEKVANTLVQMSHKINELEEELAKVSKEQGVAPVNRIDNTEIKEEMQSRINETEDRDELYNS